MEQCKHGLYPAEVCCYCNGKVKKTIFVGSGSDIVTKMKTIRIKKGGDSEGQGVFQETGTDETESDSNPKGSPEEESQL